MVSKLSCFYIYTHTLLRGNEMIIYRIFIFCLSLLWSGVRQKKKIVKATTKLKFSYLILNISHFLYGFWTVVWLTGLSLGSYF